MSYLKTANQLVSVSGQLLAYRELGQGHADRPLVLLTHLAATLDEWDPLLVDRLAEERHLILLDLPGVGASQGRVPASIPQMAAQAIAMVEALGYSEIDLLGLSMGGMVAQEVVRLKPSLVRRLILAGTGPRGGIGVDKVTGKTFQFMLKAGLEKVDPKRYIFYNHDDGGGRQAQFVLDRMAQRQKAFADKKITVLAFLTQLRAIKRWGKADRDDLSYISQPTLIVNGDEDRQVPTANSYDVHDKIANSKLIIYPNAGHGSIFQYAEEFSREVKLFLGE
ncbi:alpha/beta fold hydrolase [Streptococcus moroccensis]|uniref:Pimeloyl-ACP methyl ester carboxylesterase n=1 Tax=Streptococcus moroccensis TaxID=1451356 RepID=A0ABT9YRE9_9STRE|nr:alpha/beta hydrolase [Streptococcus moroccensis]MDQ0222304.1 pimeloyl-ACP methyl ester carboxylesterase [Streptococcus moroccensis]